MRRAIVAGCVAAIFLAATGMAASPADPVLYPDGFRRWVHIKSAVNDPAHAAFGRYGGMYSVYANKRALTGYRTGHFPDGATIVFEMNDVRTQNDNMQAVGRRFIDVMTKDSARAETGGWSFEEFEGRTRDVRNVSSRHGEAACFACHVTQKARDYVYGGFSE
jgi:predicted phage tail protein